MTKGNESVFCFRTELLSLCKKEFDKVAKYKRIMLLKMPIKVVSSSLVMHTKHNLLTYIYKTLI